MDKRVAMIVAAIMGIVAVLMVRNYVESTKKKMYQGTEMVPVIVATKNIEKGDVLSEQNIANRKYPEKYVGERAIRSEDIALVVGQTVKNNLEATKPILWSDLELRKKEGFASTIQSGMRAISVPVSDLSSLSHMIEPGSRVDILFTFDLGLVEKDASAVKEKEQVPDVKDINAFREYLIRKYSKKDQVSKQMTVVLKQNVLVLSTGKKHLAAASADLEQEKKDYSTIALMLTPAAAQELVHAMNMGKITFMLRNDSDVDTPVLTPSTEETVFRSGIASAVSFQGGEQEKKEAAVTAAPAETEEKKE